MGSAGLKVNEPSMDEILASIRRIIADDQDDPQHSEPEAPASSPLKNVLDIAELHVSPLLGASPNEPVLGPWSRGDTAFLEAHIEQDFVEAAPARRDPEGFEQAPIIVPEPVLKKAAPAAEALLSTEAVASVSGAFSRLSESVKPAQPQSVEDLMKEMLRPMLKAWLDDNLPPLVERLVREEIERVARRRA